MKINIFRFSDADAINVNIKAGVTGTEQVTNLADKMLKLDKSVENAKTQLNAFKTLLQNLSTHSTTTMKNDLTKIKAAFDSVAAMKILPADVRKSMQQLSTIFNIADKPKQLDKTIKSVNSLLDIYDKYENVRGYSTTDDDEEPPKHITGADTTRTNQSVASTVGPVKELTLGYKSLLQQEQSNIDVMAKLYSAYNNVGSATKTAKTHIVTFDDAVKISVKTLEDEQKALEKYLTVSKSSSFLKTGGDTGVISLLATTGSLQSTNNQFNNLQTYSFGVVNVLTDATKGLYNVGDAAVTNNPKLASFGDMIEDDTQKLKANTDELIKNKTAVDNYQSALSLTSTFGGGGDIAKMAASGFDQSTVSLIQEVNGALKETGAVMLNTAGKSQTLTNAMTDNRNIFQKIWDLTKKLPKTVSEVERGFRSLSLVRLTYLWGMIKRVSSSLVNAVTTAADYEESLNLYKMSIGRKYLEDAEEWSKKITEKLLIDEAQLMQYTGTFNNLTEGLGVHQDDAYEMSKALTQLTYDMSSYLNIDPSAAATKLQSAMSGQARAIQGVGVAIQSASLQELAYELGIDKKIAKMTQAEKTYLRYIQIMKTTEHMQGDLGATMITPSNAMRILRTQINLLARAIGQALTPIVMNLIPWVMALTGALTKLANWLGKLLGFEITEINLGDAFENGSNAADDFGDSVEDATKKVKNSLAPFDELNVVMSSSGSADLDNSDVLDILRKEIDGYDMLARYEDTLAERAKTLEKHLLPILNTLIALFGIKKGFDLGKWLLGATKALTGTAAAEAMAEGSLGSLLKFLLKYAAIGGAITLTIGCILKISGDLAELAQLDRVILSKENSDKKANTYTEHADKVEADVASGKITETSDDHFIEWAKDYKSLNARLDGAYDNLFGASGVIKDIFNPSTQDERRYEFDNIIDSYNEANRGAKALLESQTLSTGEIGRMKFDLEQQIPVLEKILKQTDKGTDRYNKIQAAIHGSQSLLIDIESKYLPKAFGQSEKINKSVANAAKQAAITAGNNQTISRHLDDINPKTQTWSNLMRGIKEFFVGSSDEAKDISDSLGVSEIKGGLFGKVLDFVKKVIPGIDDEVKTVNDSLGTSNTKTGTWKDNLASVEGTILDKITKPFGDFVSKFVTKKTFTVDASEAKTTVDNLVTKSNKLNSTKTLKLDVDTKKANSGLSSLFGKDSLLGKLASKVGLDVDFFADGGYPTSGELFFANENGRAEFITSIGNKTAVANQDQMVQALTNAIMAGFAMTSPRGESKQPINVNIGNERVYSGVIDYQNRQSDRYGTTTTINV